MRILAVGDIEGKFPKKITEKYVKDNKIDYVLSCGDYSNRSESRKLEFKWWKKGKHGLGDTWYNQIGLPKARKIIENELKSGERMLNKLNSFEIPIYLVLGNQDINEVTGKYPHEKNIKKLKNIIYTHKRSKKIKTFTIIGHGGYREYNTKKYKFEEVDEQTMKLTNKIIEKYRRELEKLFENKKELIFLTHDVPYNCKLDKINNSKSPIDGYHIGDETYREFIEKYQPILHICGHMHENQGKIKIGKTLVVNPGFGQKGQFAIIDLPSLKVKFVK